MESFKVALRDTISAMTKLSEEWEKIEGDYSAVITEKYPFDKDFREILSDMIDWKGHLDSK